MQAPDLRPVVTLSAISLLRGIQLLAPAADATFGAGGGETRA
jgi:hypothetical protein